MRSIVWWVHGNGIRQEYKGWNFDRTRNCLPVCTPQDGMTSPEGTVDKKMEKNQLFFSTRLTNPDFKTKYQFVQRDMRKRSHERKE
jgi:hypothetical protein